MASNTGVPGCLQLADDGVGVDDHRAPLGEQRRHGRLPRSDTPGEPDDQHRGDATGSLPRRWHREGCTPRLPRRAPAGACRPPPVRSCVHVGPRGPGALLLLVGVALALDGGGRGLVGNRSVVGLGGRLGRGASAWRLRRGPRPRRGPHRRAAGSRALGGSRSRALGRRCPRRTRRSTRPRPLRPRACARRRRCSCPRSS